MFVNDIPPFKTWLPVDSLPQPPPTVSVLVGNATTGQAKLGYNVVLDRGEIQSTHAAANTTLILNPAGGPVTSKNNTLDDGGGSAYISNALYVGANSSASGSNNLIFLYDGTNNRSAIRSAKQGTGYTPLILNDQGSTVLTRYNTLDDGSGNLTTAGNITLNGANPLIAYASSGIANPTFTTRSAGTKVVLYPAISGTAADFAIGIGANTLWNSVSTTAMQFQWYAGTTSVATLDGTGNLTTAGNITLSGTNPIITYANSGQGPPTFTTRSAGTKIALIPAVGASSADYAIGIDNGTLWNSVNVPAAQFKWYGGTTLAATLTGSGNLTIPGTLSVGSGYSAANPGWTTLPGGIIMQWGNFGVLANSNGTTTVAFPKIFPGTCFNATVTLSDPSYNNGSGAPTSGIGVQSISTTQIVFVFKSSNTTGIAITIYWQAIGN